MDNFLSVLKRVIKKIIRKTPPVYDFDKSNPLGGGGERVDFVYTEGLDTDKLDVYQISHYRRYEFACAIITGNEVCGDFACGTGYGTVMLSQKAKKAIGADINGKVISAIKHRYRKQQNVDFIQVNLLDITFDTVFDTIVSFETIEHFAETDILKLLSIYNKGLKPGGCLIISTPYLQERTDAAIKLGYHLTFYIDEARIEKWLTDTGFRVVQYKYQNYDTHIIADELEKKDFIICQAQKL